MFQLRLAADVFNDFRCARVAFFAKPACGTQVNYRSGGKGGGKSAFLHPQRARAARPAARAAR